MWLRRVVGVVLIVALLGMNVIAILGLFIPDKKQANTPESAETQQILNEKPTVSLTVDPGTIAMGDTAALTWETTGSPTSCTATGAWQGVKTPFGAESTGRLNTLGNFTYTLECTNPAGSAATSATLTVSKSAVASKSSSSNKSTSSTPTSKTYCNGRIICYSTKEIASHNTKGNCWGWLGDRVINVTGFDTGFHAVRSGVSSVEIGAVCGKDLTPSVTGRVPAGDYPSGHEHTLGATSNSDKNYLNYFVGYYDASKP